MVFEKQDSKGSLSTCTCQVGWHCAATRLSRLTGRSNGSKSIDKKNKDNIVLAHARTFLPGESLSLGIEQSESLAQRSMLNRAYPQSHRTPRMLQCCRQIPGIEE